MLEDMEQVMEIVNAYKDLEQARTIPCLNMNECTLKDPCAACRIGINAMQRQESAWKALMTEAETLAVRSPSKNI